MTGRQHTDHIGEDRLELLLLSPGLVDPAARSEMEDHLASCALCAAAARDIGTMHGLISESGTQGPTEEDRRFADRIIQAKRGILPSQALERVPGEALDGYAEVIEPTMGGLARRIAGYVRVHPMKSGTALSFAAALAALAYFTLRTAPDLNPVYAKFAAERLHVFNRSGDTIWTKLAPGMPERGSEHATMEGQQRVVMVEDIDGDGTGEVLVNGISRESFFSSESLYCFTGDGRKKWTAGFGPVVRLGNLEYLRYAVWDVKSFFTVRIPGERAARLFVTEQAVPYMTSKLSEVDPSDGSERQAYWHAGGLALDALCDVAGDSTPEIVLAAINNGLRSVAISVLDPRNIAGHGTTIPEYVPPGIPRADELYYITLSPTDLADLTSDHRYNVLAALAAIERSTVQVHTTESSSGEKNLGGIIYTFGRGMRLLSAEPSDVFVRNRELFVRKGNLRGPTDAAYVEKLKEGVVYHRGMQQAARGGAPAD